MKRFLLRVRVKRYSRENPGALFVMFFQELLLVCAGLLIAGNSAWPEGIAAVAYLSLVIGVVLQLISFLRRGKQREWSE